MSVAVSLKVAEALNLEKGSGVVVLGVRGAGRSGTSNGRLYFIAFKADDGKGATCTNAVTVGVPHDRGQNAMPIDTGQRYDSTQP